VANRFEQVDEMVDDAITVALERRPDGDWARIFCPQSAHASLREDWATEAMAPNDALSAAVKLANNLKLAIVVVDPGAAWRREWGELYRAADDADES